MRKFAPSDRNGPSTLSVYFDNTLRVTEASNDDHSASPCDSPVDSSPIPDSPDSPSPSYKSVPFRVENLAETPLEKLCVHPSVGDSYDHDTYRFANCVLDLGSWGRKQKELTAGLRELSVSEHREWVENGNASPRASPDVIDLSSGDASADEVQPEEKPKDTRDNNKKKKKKRGPRYPPTVFTKRARSKRRHSRAAATKKSRVNPPASPPPPPPSSPLTMSSSPDVGQVQAIDCSGPASGYLRPCSNDYSPIRSALFRPMTPPVPSPQPPQHLDNRDPEGEGEGDDMDDFEHDCNILQLIPPSSARRQHFRASNLPPYLRMVSVRGAALVYNPHEPKIIAALAAALVEDRRKWSRIGRHKASQT